MLHLYVYNFDDDSDREPPPTALRVSDYLNYRPAWEPAFEDTWLLLDHFNCSETVPLIDSNPFGLLNFLVPQMEEAALRLEAGERAVIRSAAEGRATFFVLEPEGRITRLSALTYLPEPWGSYYPLINSPSSDESECVDQQKSLYDYIERYREELRPKSGMWQNRDQRDIQRLKLPTDELIVSLKEEAKAGYRLLNLGT